ncbi:hypothetical protein NBRC110019_00970 [Neptunitalea chrysea]|uniref:DUF1573 domain-containing protein n=1 Tax=Neptunitalea chrysea TaxID=1647581 RepID=A0A9W6B5F0_9FLAO|nr:DUF1573 domain-containing protein [Neptunitalea chrysea]GLB51058.1 hypothetical protein NBRC110019_00970 [Neptunitalea chrysea]
MKKLILLCSVAFFSLTATYAQTAKETPATKEAAVPQDGPKITFDKETIDYGTVEYKGDGVREFKFTNTGNSPLVLTKVKGSCGCTVPTAPLNKPFAPGESGVISVKYATNRPGHFTKIVTVTSNAVDNNIKKVRITGTVKPDPNAPAPTAEQKR